YRLRAHPSTRRHTSASFHGEPRYLSYQGYTTSSHGTHRALPRHSLSVGSRGHYKDIVVVCSSGQPAVAAMFYGIIAAGGVFWLVVSRDKIEVGKEAAKLIGLSLVRVVVLNSEPKWEVRSLEGEKNMDVENGARMTWRRVTDEEEMKRSLVVLLYSSGTTGVPKGVMLSHHNLLAQLYIPSIQARAHVAAAVTAGEPTPALQDLRASPNSPYRWLFWLPNLPILFHRLCVLDAQVSWMPFLEYFKKLQIAGFYTVPSIFLQIAKSADVTDQFDSVEIAITGAAPIGAELQQAANRKLGKGKTRINGKQMNWLTFFQGAVTAMPRGSSDITGSISPVLPNMEMRIVDDYDVTPGQPGEIIVRGPFVTNGYFDNEDATNAAFHDGWFCTGDIAVDRGGKFYIVDRKKELNKYKVLQIAPAEFGNHLIMHQQILEAAVVGVLVEGGGEVPRAYVAPRNPGALSEDDVKVFVKSHLAEYKQLRGGVMFVDELPKNAVGKILRRGLRDRAREGDGIKAKL
ncbi:acetyl-CoA synthetase-like protein, partial [Lindgomyces ingoldianus]